MRTCEMLDMCITYPLSSLKDKVEKEKVGSRANQKIKHYPNFQANRNLIWMASGNRASRTKRVPRVQNSWCSHYSCTLTNIPSDPKPTHKAWRELLNANVCPYHDLPPNNQEQCSGRACVKPCRNSEAVGILFLFYSRTKAQSCNCICRWCCPAGIDDIRIFIHVIFAARCILLLKK